MSKPASGSGCLTALGLIAFCLVWKAWSFWAALAICVALVVAGALVSAASRKARLAELTARFGAEAAHAIIAGQYWQGATREMMYEVFGRPVEVKQSVMKTKTRETHCYRPTGKNRYALRLHYENGVLVGWDV